jgi:glucose-6-phosphate 1-dehydrogenase
LEPASHRERADYDGGGFWRAGAVGAFYEQVGAIRDVIQNHLFQVLANLAMEPPIRTDSESIRDEKVKVLKGHCTA